MFTTKDNKKFFTYDNDNGEEITVEVPSSYEVCSRCEGKGKHVNPNIDGHGITQSEWEHDWSFEEQEDYLSGAYDVMCHDCRGLRVQLDVDWEALEKHNPELLKRIEEWERDEAYYAAERAAERRMGY